MTDKSNDPIAPRSAQGDVLCGPLIAVTIISGEMGRSAHFYTDVMEMTAWTNGVTEPAQQELQRRVWGFGPDIKWKEHLFYRPLTPAVPFLRILESSTDLPQLRPETDVLLEGGLSVGFAMRDMEAAVRHGEALGFTTTAGIAKLAMTRADGSAYDALECHFEAPDCVLALGVGRPPDLSPVGPVEPDRNVGGPAYSAQVVNNADPTLAFYRDVVGYEIRRDVTVSGPGPEKGLRLPPGTPVRFLQVFAPGSTSGYLVFLDFGARGKANPRLHAPARGVVMWTFPTQNISEVRSRGFRFGLKEISETVTVENPYFGRHLAMTMRAPNGYLVEFVQRL